MTTKVSQIYDALETLVASTLTAYSQLPNPYNLENNNELYLTKGYAVSIGDGSNTERLINCQRTYSRNYILSLVNLITSREHDYAAFKVIEKSLLDDVDSLINSLEQDTQLGGLAIKILGVSDTGLNFLEGDRAKYLAVEVSVAVEYSVNL